MMNQEYNSKTVVIILQFGVSFRKIPLGWEIESANIASGFWQKLR